MTLDLADTVEARAVVLVEGMSDRVALEALAQRRGWRLDVAGTRIVSMNGVTNFGHFLDVFGPRGRNVRLAGLCDAAEDGWFRRGLERTGFGSNLSRRQMEALGFYVCVEDLEDELIRCLGVAEVERIIEGEGELRSLRILQQQPAHQGRSTVDQLRRFMGSRSGRKSHYARLLVGALDLTRVPRALDQVLARV